VVEFSKKLVSERWVFEMGNPQFLKIKTPTHFAHLFVPLYGFRSDVDCLQFSDSIQVLKYNSKQLNALLPEEGTFRDFLKFFEPDYLMFRRASVPGSDLAFDDFGVRPSKLFPDELFVPLDRLVTSLRLFKPGALRRGGTWLLATELVKPQMEIGPLTKDSELEFAWQLQVQPKGLHLSSLERRKEIAYELKDTERPYFQVFKERLDLVLEKLKESPRFGLAAGCYQESYEAKDLKYQLIDLFMCLEALLLRESDELSFRLALRSANLLGADNIERKRVYQDIKDFYVVRCKVVHGDTLNPKHSQRLNDIHRLRELVRRALLFSMSLASQIGPGTEFYGLLDEMNLDEDLRRNTQEKASELLHLRS